MGVLFNLLCIVNYGIINIVFNEIIRNVFRRNSHEKFEKKDKKHLLSSTQHLTMGKDF